MFATVTSDCIGCNTKKTQLYLTAESLNYKLLINFIKSQEISFSASTILILNIP